MPCLPATLALHQGLSQGLASGERGGARSHGARLKARPEILDRRREVVEHPFGSIKQWMGQGAFLMKGLDKVRAEFSLTALVYNLRRAINIRGVETMMAAVRA